jgi:PKHD-type hydroxylase
VTAVLESLASKSSRLPWLPAQAAADEPDADFICRPINVPGALTKAECSAIVELGRQGAGVTAGLARPIEGYRTGVTRVIAPDGDSRWVYDRIGEIILQVNHWYRFDLAGFAEALLYCEYPEGGHFDWHVDCGEGRTATRKISLSVQLSDAGDYVGGGLEFAAHGELREARRIGTAVAFPAFLHHRVQRVTRGLRRSLVAWAHGPMFR